MYIILPSIIRDNIEIDHMTQYLTVTGICLCHKVCVKYRI